MRKLRILEIVDVRWWNACAYYGVTIAEGLRRVGHEVIVLGLRRSPSLIEAQTRELHTESLPLESYNPVSYTRNIRRLRELINSEKIDIVNAHRPEGHFYAVRALHNPGGTIPLVRTVGDVRLPKNHLLNRWLHRRMTDFYITSAESVRKVYVEKMNLDPGSVVVIRCGLDIETFRYGIQPGIVRQRFGLTQEIPILGIVARLSPEKGHDYFIKAAAIVNRSFPDTYFLIAGEEQQVKFADLRLLSQSLGFSNKVLFLKRGPDAKDIIADLDVGVICSLKSEAICRIAAEYMALGKPVIGTDMNVIPEMVEHGKTGFIVPPMDPEALAEAMIRLLQDRSMAKEFGLSGAKKAEAEFSLEFFVQQTEKVYYSVVEGFSF